MTNIRSIFHCVMLLTTSSIMAVSQNAPLLNDSSHSTDAPPTLEKAKSQSNLVLLGKVTNLGKYDFRGKNSLVYDVVTASVLTVYMGDATSPIKLHIKLTRLNEAPVRGSEYLFFIREKEHRNYVIEFLPATDDNIAKVKALIATAPAGK